MKDHRTYTIDSRLIIPSFEDYYGNYTYGEFSEDGFSYTVTDSNTPREWMNILSNARMASVISNRGRGFFSYGSMYNRITRYYDPEFYIARRLDGARTAELCDLETGETINLFDAPSLICTVTPAASIFTGIEMGVGFRLTLFVPEDVPCECWLLELENRSDRPRRLQVHVSESLSFFNAYGEKEPARSVQVTQSKHGFDAVADHLGSPFDSLYTVFVMDVFSHGYSERRVEKTLCSKQKNVLAGTAVYKDFSYTDLHLYSNVVLPVGKKAERCVLAGASHMHEELASICSSYLCYERASQALEAVQVGKRELLLHNRCEIPDKHLERFLNVWLKNQVHLIYRYNRNRQNAGFRDLWQDMWGAMLLHPDFAKQRMNEALSHVYRDGHSMRGYDSYMGVTSPKDYVDCPLWAPAGVAQYVKETGDVAYLQEQIGYFDSEETESVIEHL